MKIIGITGGIASGKSSISKMFVEDFQLICLDSDMMAKEALQELWELTRGEKVSKVLGVNIDEISDIKGNLDRNKIGHLIFSDQERRKSLEKELHPLVIKTSEKMFDIFRMNNNVKYVLYESALLVETGRYKNVDVLITVFCDDETRIKRLMLRNSLSKEEAQARINAQLSQLEKIKVSDFVIDNSKTLECSKEQVIKIWKEIKSQTGVDF